MRLLFIDDDAELRMLVARSFPDDSVVTVRDEPAALDVETFDVVIVESVDFCRTARARDISTPILILSRQASVQDRVEALDAGADDFLSKPFALAELRARIRALGRRRGKPSKLVWERDNLIIDFPRRHAAVASVAVPLTRREWGILEYVAASGGRVVSKSELVEKIWGTHDGAASLEVLVARIRRKLGEDILRTIRGEGYAMGE